VTKGIPLRIAAPLDRTERPPAGLRVDAAVPSG
jgi:hypothetical protein